MSTVEVLRPTAARILYTLPLLLLAAAPVRASTIVVHAFSNRSAKASHPFGRLLQAPDGFLYGTASATTAYSGNGAIFREDPATNTLIIVYNFTGSGSAGTGSGPRSGLILAADGKLYGTCETGGRYGYGTVFSIDLSTAPVTVTKIHDFNDVAADGAFPESDSVIQASDGYLYGATRYGGTSDYGVVWKMALNGSSLTVLHSFTGPDGAGPMAGVIEGSDGKLYGTAEYGGANNLGTVYYLRKDGSGFGVAHSFSAAPMDGYNPQTGLTRGLGGKLYGTTQFGGLNDNGSDGIIYSIDPSAGNAFSIVYNFNGTTGANPLSALSSDGSGNLYGTTWQGGANGYGTAYMLDTSLNCSVLVSYTGTDTYEARCPPIPAADGNLYGVSMDGGLGVQYTGMGNGSLYSVAIDPATRQGSTTLLHSLGVYEDGANSQCSPVLGADGNLYGVTFSGGILNQGVFYQTSPTGGYQILHVFSQYAQEGQNPTGVIQGPDGNFYGTCATGGQYGAGTVWMMDGSGNLTVLYSFSGSDGSSPNGRLLVGADGSLYGTTVSGGAAGFGTVFTLTMNGSGFTDLHDFDPAIGNDGASPYAGLVQDASGTLYGAASSRGANGCGAFFKLNTDGTGYALLHSLTSAEGSNPYGSPILVGSALYAVCKSGANGYGSLVSVDTASGTAGVVRAFNYVTDGGYPQGDLSLGPDGSFYGTNSDGGHSSGVGTAWKLDTSRGFTILQTFNASTGAHPYGGVVVDGSGTIYGATAQGGPTDDGMLFSIR